MANKFVRASLYRHVHGVASKPENEFTHIKAQATGDGTFIAANEKLFAYAGALPGRVHIWPLDKPGRIGADAPYIHVHKAGVLDYEFNTLFHDELTGGGIASLLATGSDDCAVAVTAIPNTGLKSNITDATLTLQGHERRVNVVHWHPTASNLLATGSADQTIKVWDIGAQKEALSFDGFGDGVSAFDWHCHGAHLIATCKDTKVRVYDPRSTDSVQTFQGFNGAGISRMVWKGDSTQVIGVGNIKGGSRQMGIWDTKNPSKPIMVQDLDNAGGSLFPYYDPDNTILYISGKGDGQIRYWEVTEEEPYVHFISAFTDTKSHAGVAFLPKKACDYAECEIAIALRMMGDKVTKVSFRVPRKQTGPTVFHKDLYPETSSGLKPASLSADEWLAGENRPIVKMPMNIASGAREMTSALATPTTRTASASVSVSGTISPRNVSTSLSAPASTSGRSIPELERMLAQAKLKIMDLQAELFELEQKAAKKTLDKDSAAALKAAASTASSAPAAASASAAATSTSPTASNTTSPISSPRDSSASVTTRDAAASISTEALPGESEAQTAARIKKAKAKAAAMARDKEAARAAEKNASADLDKAKKEAEDKIRREQQAAQAEKDAEKKAKEEKEKAEKKAKEEKEKAEKKAKEEKEAAEKKAKQEKDKAEKKAKEERDAAEKKIKEEKEAAEKKLKAEKEKAEKEAATLKVQAEKEAALRKASAASAASADSDASHHMRFHGDDDDEDDDDAEAERMRAETVAKAEAIERAEALAKKQKEIEAKAKATMEEKKKKAKDDASDMKTSASAAVSAATSAATSPTNSAPSSEPSSPTGSKKGKKGKKEKKDKKKGDCIIC